MVASPATGAGQNSALVLSFRARLRSAWQNLLAARQAEAAKRSGVSNQESALSVKTPCTHAVWHIHYQNTTARIAPKRYRHPQRPQPQTTALRSFRNGRVRVQAPAGVQVRLYG